MYTGGVLQRGAASSVEPRPPRSTLALEAAFRENVGTCRAATAGIATNDVMAVGIQRFHFQAQRMQGNVDRAVGPIVLELRRQTHVDPLPVFRGDDALGALVVDPLEQRFVQQLAEIVLRQPHQHAVGDHGHGGVALHIGDQRFLAEGIAHLELGEPHAILVERRLARDLANTFDDDVEIIARHRLA